MIRGVAKAAMNHGLQVIGIRDGFRSLVENRVVVAGIKRIVPPDHAWVNTARLVDTCLGI